MDIVPRNYYSPVPDPHALPDHIWTRASRLGGLDFDPDAQLKFLARDLGPLISEWTPALEPTGRAGDFYLHNPTYGSVDGEVLYAMVRLFKPGLIMELGSGRSSLVIADACNRNRSDGSPVDHEVFDPYPWLDGLSEAAVNVKQISATEIPMAEFERLRAGDILFVDTTHTVKVGGDVNYLILDVLPALAPGVLVHFHDIFLPWEYPREWLVDEHFYWTEQHLLQGFLAFNREFEVLLSAHAVAKLSPAEVGRVIPSFTPGVRPGAFWLRRVASTAAG